MPRIPDRDRSSLRRRTDPGLVVASLAAASWSVALAGIGILRHLAFQSNAYDLGLQQHVVWNTARGRWFEYTYMVAFPPYLTNHLGDHVNLILLPIAALYWLHDGPETLIVVQALLVGSGLIPLFLVARRHVGADVPALMLAALYLLHPATQAAVLFDFHPIVLCAPLFLWAYWLAHADRPGWLAVAVLLMLATQENAALIVAMLGAVLLLGGLRRTGLLLLLVGVIWFAVCFFVLLPALNPTGSNAFKRYRHFGASWGEVAHHLATHPNVLFAWIAGDGARAYLGRLLLPFGYLSVLAPEVLVGATSEVALNLLSFFPPQRTIEHHYASVPVAIAALAAAVGTARLARWVSRLARIPSTAVATGLATGALVASLAVQQRDHGGPRALAHASLFAHQYTTPRGRAGRAIVRELPPDVPISAQSAVAPHVSRRPVVYVFPTVREADWVVLDTRGSRFPVEILRLPGRDEEASYREYVRRLVEEDGFVVHTERDGWTVLHRPRDAAGRPAAASGAP